MGSGRDTIKIAYSVHHPNLVPTDYFASNTGLACTGNNAIVELADYTQPLLLVAKRLAQISSNPFVLFDHFDVAAELLAFPHFLLSNIVFTSLRTHFAFDSRG